MTLSLMMVASAASSCGAGKYGHSRHYEPYGDEEAQIKGTHDVAIADVERNPTQFMGTNVSWFGVVEEIFPEKDPVQMILSYRKLQPRNLCRTESESSCRVTVSGKKFGTFRIRIEIRPEDKDGKDKLAAGSLLRIVGSVTGGVDADRIPVVNARWYRHWPFRYYVTTDVADTMRR